MLGKTQRDDPRLFLKAALIGIWFAASYVLLLTSTSTVAQIFFCISFAFSAAVMGFNIFHDANHGSFSTNARVNLILSQISCTVLGVGRCFWCYKHNVLHHRFTSVFEWDDDIETRGHLRMSLQQPWDSKFKNQHRYFFFLYGLNTIEWVFVKDFAQYFTMRINQYQTIPAMSASEKLEFWLCKAIYLAVFVALPFFVYPAWTALAGMLLFHFILGLTLAFIFNLAHVVEKVEFPATTGSPPIIDDDWAAHQMKTTVNFGTRNRALNWFAGGLNFQIEHHLFPAISHVHYADFGNIVSNTAAEFSLPYNNYDTYRDAVKSHWAIVRKLGTPPLAQPALAAPAT